MIHILSIDDSKAVHAFLETLLDSSQYRLSHAFDGAEGFDVLSKSQGNGFDLVLLDWEMPKLTGVETLQKIRGAGFKLPVVMVTTKNAPEEIMQALSLGANEYVMKPFTRDILIEKLETVLGKK